MLLVCDGCGQVDELPDGGETHYTDAEHARQETSQYGWTYTDDRDLCVQCSAEAACAREGHTPDLASRGAYCSRCEEPIGDTPETNIRLSVAREHALTLERERQLNAAKVTAPADATGRVIPLRRDQ